MNNMLTYMLKITKHFECLFLSLVSVCVQMTSTKSQLPGFFLHLNLICYILRSFTLHLRLPYVISKSLFIRLMNMSNIC